MDLETFMSNYDIGNIIGKGPNCLIKRCTNHETGLHYLVKIVDIGRSNQLLEAINREVNVCEDLKHIFISPVLEAFTNDNFCYTIYEYMQGADLLVEIVNRANSGFVYSEAVASHYLKQLLEAVTYLQEEKGIIHGNIGPHCIALATKENSSPLKLLGFNFASSVETVDKMNADSKNNNDSIWISFERDKFGPTVSPITTAPEILEGGKASLASDMWSVGCIMHMLLVGEVPYLGSTSQQRTQICKYPIKMMGSCWEPISTSARDLLSRMMDRDPENRILAIDALKHPWIKDRLQSSKTHLVQTVKNLQKFNALRTLKEHVLVSAYSSSWSMANDDNMESSIFQDINDNDSLANGIIRRVLDSLDIITALKNCDNVEKEILEQIFQDAPLIHLLNLYEDVHRITYYKCPPYDNCASNILNDVIDSLEGRGQSSAAICHELQDIALQPHFISLLRAHDVIANEIRCSSPTRFNSQLSELNTPNGQQQQQQQLNSPVDDQFASLLKASLNKDLAMKGEAKEDLNVTSVRVFKFFKSPNEPMGITIKMNKEQRCIVSRIIFDGMIHQKVAMKAGDEILDINGTVVKGLPLEKVQKLLMDCHGNVSLKVLPGQRLEPMHCEMFIRTLFNYDPKGDQFIPAENAGIAFKVGDILEVLSKDDENWWQARKWNPHSSTTPAGLIPSPLLYEWKTACSVAEKSKKKKVPTATLR